MLNLYTNKTNQIEKYFDGENYTVELEFGFLLENGYQLKVKKLYDSNIKSMSFLQMAEDFLQDLHYSDDYDGFFFDSKDVWFDKKNQKIYITGENPEAQKYIKETFSYDNTEETWEKLRQKLYSVQVTNIERSEFY